MIWGSKPLEKKQRALGADINGRGKNPILETVKVYSLSFTTAVLCFLIKEIPYSHCHMPSMEIPQLPKKDH